MKYPNRFFIDLKTARFFYQSLLAQYNYYADPENPDLDPLIMIEVSNGLDAEYRFTLISPGEEIEPDEEDDEDGFGFDDINLN